MRNCGVIEIMVLTVTFVVAFAIIGTSMMKLIAEVRKSRGRRRTDRRHGVVGLKVSTVRCSD